MEKNRIVTESLAAKGTRKPRQRRSEERRDAIVRAAITVIGRDGLARLTHRSVASEAGVPLAATTYYYATRNDIIAAASASLLAKYVTDYAHLAQRLRPSPPWTLGQVALRTVVGGVEKHRISTLAWCEIMLNCARDGDGQTMAREWFGTILDLWRDIAVATGSPKPVSDAVSAIDTVTGLLLIVLALSVDGKDISAVFRPDGDTPEVWACDLHYATLPGTQARVQKRGDLARDKIVSAAADIVTEGGPGPLTLRNVAMRAGVSPAAPGYYFHSVQDLTNATLWRLFDDSKSRYRSAVSATNTRPSDPEQLADLSAAIFIREATEYRTVALSSQPLRLEAARQPALRAAAWGGIDDQSRAWTRQLTASGIVTGDRGGLLVQSLFLGKLVRCLAINASTAELAHVRRQFAEDFNAMASGIHWAKNWYI